MKLWHLLHIIALITLFCLGVYYLGVIEQAGRPNAVFPSSKGIPTTRLAAFAAFVVFAFSAIVGWRVRAERKGLGTLWFLSGFGGSCWMVLMWSSPSHISLIEVFPFWIIYIMLGIIASAYAISVLKGTPYFDATNYEDELLDN